MASQKNDNSRPLPLWFKVSTEIMHSRTWREPLVLRLWLYLLAQAKRANLDGRVRFSYPHAMQALAWYDNKRRWIVPSRTMLRLALEKLERRGNSVASKGVQARAQGGAQGYIDVTVCDWKTWYGPKHEEGIGEGTALLPKRVQERTEEGTPSTEKKERGKSVAHRAPSRPGPQEQIAQYLLGAIRSHKPDFKRPSPTAFRGWVTQIELAIRRDKRDPEQLREAIDFAHRDSADVFWRSKTLSGAALRRQFDTLTIQARQSSSGAREAADARDQESVDKFDRENRTAERTA